MTCNVDLRGRLPRAAIRMIATSFSLLTRGRFPIGRSDTLLCASQMRKDKVPNWGRAAESQEFKIRGRAEIDLRG
jgi:hypothetical protein